LFAVGIAVVGSVGVVGAVDKVGVQATSRNVNVRSMASR
jgi:hypothetical protein